MKKPKFFNSELNFNWPNHKGYFKTIKEVRDCKEMIEIEEAVMGDDHALYILNVNLTPYFYKNIEDRDKDYHKVVASLQ